MPTAFIRFLSFALFFQQLRLPRHIAALALGKYILANVIDAGLSNNAASDQNLKRNPELMEGNQLLEFFPPSLRCHQ